MYIKIVQLHEICKNLQEYIWECIKSVSMYMSSPGGSLPIILKISYLNGFLWFNGSFYWVKGHLLDTNFYSLGEWVST